MMKAMAIVVVGSINIDLVTSVEAFPAPGETVAARGFQMHPGGKGANQAVAAARLGAEVRMIGMLGGDAFADLLRDGLSHNGVDHRGVGMVPGPSGVASITVDARGENTIVVAAGANAGVTRDYLDRQAGLLDGASIVLAQLEVPLDTVLHLARLCADRRLPLMLDPAPAQVLPPALLPLVEWFTPNETEARFYLGATGNTTSDAAEAWLAAGCRGVILKQGAQGATLLQAGSRCQARPPAVEPVDTTAAGDTFNGAFAAELARGCAPCEALQFATAAAAVSVTRQGAQPSMPTRSDVERLRHPRG